MAFIELSKRNTSCQHLFEIPPLSLQQILCLFLRAFFLQQKFEHATTPFLKIHLWLPLALKVLSKQKTESPWANTVYIYALFGNTITVIGF